MSKTMFRTAALPAFVAGLALASLALPAIADQTATLGAQGPYKVQQNGQTYSCPAGTTGTKMRVGQAPLCVGSATAAPTATVPSSIPSGSVAIPQATPSAPTAAAPGVTAPGSTVAAVPGAQGPYKVQQNGQTYSCPAGTKGSRMRVGQAPLCQL